MPIFDVAIIDGATSCFREEYASIEIARDAVIRSAIKMMLESPSQDASRTADCSVIDHIGGQERTFMVSLSIVDYV